MHRPQADMMSIALALLSGHGLGPKPGVESKGVYSRVPNQRKRRKRLRGIRSHGGRRGGAAARPGGAGVSKSGEYHARVGREDAIARRQEEHERFHEVFDPLGVVLL